MLTSKMYLLQYYLLLYMYVYIQIYIYTWFNNKKIIVYSYNNFQSVKHI